MQLSNIHLTGNLPNRYDLSFLKIGQRLLVEVIEKQADGEGLISLAGKTIRAKLDANVRAGEQFPAVVQELGKNSIVLKREHISPAILQSLSPQETVALINRGLHLDPKLVPLLTKFLSEQNSNILSLLTGKTQGLPESLLSSLKQFHVPVWQEIREHNSIKKYFRQLGLEHESSIFRFYKTRKEPVLEFSLKMKVLQLLAEEDEPLTAEKKHVLQGLLDEITGQQLWYQSGTGRNAYFILHFPIQDQENYYLVKLAVESKRKGKKMDDSHYRLALQLETPNLGNIGVDLLFYEKDMNFTVICEEPELLRPLLEEMREEMKNSLAALGKNMRSISVKKYSEHPQFIQFISGKQLGGVDFKG